MISPALLELFRKFFRFGSITRLLVLQTSLFTFSAEVKGLHSLLTIGKLLLSNKNFKKFVTRDQEKSKRKLENISKKVSGKNKITEMAEWRFFGDKY